MQKMTNISDFTAYFDAFVPLNYNDYDLAQNATGHVPFDNESDLLGDNRTYVSGGEDSLFLVIPLTIMYTAIFLAGVIGNVSTCIVIVRNKCMHTATNYYLFSLAISDLLLLLSGLPPEIYKMWDPDVYPFGEMTCRLLGLSSETSANATVLTITAFTIERYIAICHPFMSHTMSKLSRVVKFIIAIWFVALCLALPQAIQFGVVTTLELDKLVIKCTVKKVLVEHAFEISGFVFFVGPMTAITVLYVLIGVKLRTSRLLRPSKKSSLNSNSDHNGNARSYKNSVSQSRAIKMLIAVTVSFFICWAPFHAQRLLAVYGISVDEPSSTLLQAYTVLDYLSGILYFLSTAINPFLYNIMSNKFREAFKNTFVHRCCCNGRLRHSEKCYRRSNHSCKILKSHRLRTLSSGTKLTALNSLPQMQNGEGNNNSRTKHLQRSVSAIILKNDTIIPEDRAFHYEKSKLYETRIKPPNKFTERLLKSTRAVFMPKIDDSSSDIKCNFHKSKRIQCDSTDSARSHSISNSSLQDMDEEEFTGKELATFMAEVNHNIN